MGNEREKNFHARGEGIPYHPYIKDRVGMDRKLSPASEEIEIKGLNPYPTRCHLHYQCGICANFYLHV